VCQLLDVGLVPDAYWIVMPRYRCSLAQWRAALKAHPPSHPQAAALYLAVLLQVGSGLFIASVSCGARVCVWFEREGHKDMVLAAALYLVFPGCAAAGGALLF
jgi:hypothetical protein